MSTDTKRGTIWQDDENDAIVSDYFAMLALELSGIHYIKSRHSAALMAEIGRSHRSVEFKHQNISAALDKLGLPWIPGYKPKLNYQRLSWLSSLKRLMGKRKTVRRVSRFPTTLDYDCGTS